MRITIVIGPFLPMPPAPGGAVERLWRDLAEEFVRCGNEVTILCRRYAEQQNDETINGVRYIRRMGSRSTGRIAVNLLKDLVYSVLLWPRLPRADIVITNTFWMPVLARFGQEKSGKLVVAVHRLPKGQMKLYRKAALLATVSRAVHDAVIEQCPACAPITRVLPNPIDTASFIPPAKPRDYHGARTILYTGRIHPEKGIHLLIEAFAILHRELSDLRLKVLGPSSIERGGGGESYMNQLRQKAQGLPVQFREPIYDRRELARELQSAHYYCYPSLAEKGESFGIAPLEAMATGLAPVVSSLACFSDFLEDGINGLMFDHRAADAPHNLAEALGRLVRDPQLAQMMGQRAAQVAQQFSNARIAQRYLETFRELLGQPSPLPPRTAGVPT